MSTDDQAAAQMAALMATLNAVVRHLARLDPENGPELFEGAMASLSEIYGKGADTTPAREMIWKTLFDGVQHQREPSAD